MIGRLFLVGCLVVAGEAILCQPARADLTVCNQTGTLIGVALVEPNGRTSVNGFGVEQDRLRSSGWWQIQAGACRDVSSGTVHYNTGLRAEGTGYTWPSQSWFKACVNETDRFTVSDQDYLNEDPCPGGTALLPFEWLDLAQGGSYNYTFTFR